MKINAFGSTLRNTTISSGWSITNRDAPGYYARQNDGTWILGHGGVMDLSSVALAEALEDVDWDLLQIKALADMNQQFNLLTFALEDLRGLPDMIKGSCGLLQDILRRYRHQAYRFTDAKGIHYPWSRPLTNKDLSGAYLMWSFGWGPFLKSLKDIYEVETQAAAAAHAKKLRRSAAQTSSNGSAESLKYYEQSEWKGEYQTKANGTLKAMVGILGKPETKGYSFDPIETGWELVAWSWALDYLFNVAARYGALKTLALSGQLIGWRGYRWECTSKANWVGDTKDPISGSYWHSSTVDVVQTNRQPISLSANSVVNAGLDFPSARQLSYLIAAASQLPKQTFKLF